MWLLLFSPLFSRKWKHKGTEYIVVNGRVRLTLRISVSRPELFIAAKFCLVLIELSIWRHKRLMHRGLWEKRNEQIHYFI